MSQDFVFVGEALAFDFVNTEVVVRRKPFDLLQTADDLRDWWMSAASRYEHQTNHRVGVTDDILARAKHLRGTLRYLFDALVEKRDVRQQDLAAVNDILRSGYSQLQTSKDGSLVVNQVTNSSNELLLAIVHSTMWLITKCDRERLRKCKNDHCVLMFLDTTKNSNRVWCTTDCMNRARSSAHYRQHTALTPTPKGEGL